MMRWVALLCCLSMLVTAASAQTMTGTLLVANRDGGSISFFDIESGIEMARLPIGARVPHEIAVSPDGRTALTGLFDLERFPESRVLVTDHDGPDGLAYSALRLRVLED
jgi:hypothetical protein